MRTITLLLLLAPLLVLSTKSAPQLLGEKAFKSFRASSPHSVILFTAPWCGHCKALSPVFDETRSKLAGAVPLAVVDCETDKAVCEAQLVSSLPTVKGFGAKEGQGAVYTGEHTVHALEQFARRLQDPAWEPEGSTMAMPELRAMRVKALKAMLKARGVECVGCTEKGEFVQRAFDTQHIKPKPTMTVAQERRWDLAAGVAMAGFGVEEGVLHATHTHYNNWHTLRQEHKHVFTLFYATWCEHCAHAQKPFALAAANLSEHFKVPFVAIDCDSNKGEIAECASIAGFPEFWLVNNDNTNASFSASSMAVEDFEEFLNEHSGGAPSSPWQLQVQHLVSTQDLTDFSSKAPHGGVVMFHAPWCAHCKQLKPEFIAAAIAAADVFGFGAVDCTKHDALCRGQGVKGFPTVQYYPAQNKDNNPAPEEFLGDRSAHALLTLAKSKGAEITEIMFEKAEIEPALHDAAGAAEPVAPAAFDTFADCKACTEAGHGWCPIRRMCGGFANKRCRGDSTDKQVGFDGAHRRRHTPEL